MPRGYTKLPDGRQVPSHSKEGRDYRASLKGVTPKGVTPKALQPPPKVVKTDVDGAEANVTFAPPPPAIGSPKKDPEVPKGAKNKKEEKADEIEDFKQLVAALFFGFAAVSGCPEYKFNEPECEAVAKPLSRIVARYAGVRKVVSQVADPIALLGAVAFPLMLKHAHVMHRKTTPQMQEPSQAPVSNVQTQRIEGPPPPPVRNGSIPFDNVIARISVGEA